MTAYCGPLFHTLRQIPSIALIPMFVLFFGIEETFKVVIVAKAAFFPVALAASEGVKAIPRSYFEVADVYRLRWPTLLREVALPAAAPPILTGLRISLTRAWVVLVAAELLAADSGLGQMIEMSRQMLRIDVVMVGVVMAGLVGFALDFLFRLLERHLFRWKAR
ncbi:putative aliphatic sulfonates transport permease protein SsuC [compost metagenome]